MLLEELNSAEADEYAKRHPTIVSNSTTTSTESNSNSTSTVISQDDDVTTTSELIQAVKPQESQRPFSAPSSATKHFDYPETSTTIISDDYSDDTATSFIQPETPPILLSEFANQLANGMKIPSEPTLPPPTTTTNPPVFAQFPDETFPYMVSAAKEFICRYLSMEQWKRLKTLLKTIKDVGGSRIDIHRAATLFISKVISKTEMEEITKRKNELFRTFSRRYLNRRKLLNH